MRHTQATKGQSPALTATLKAIGGLASREDCHAAFDAVREQVRLLDRRAVAEKVTTGGFRRGAQVSFEGRGGIRMTGTIENANAKTFTVLASNGHRWRVPGSSLALVEEPTAAAEARP